MPPKKNYRKKAAPRRRMPNRRRRLPANVAEQASCSEVLQITDGRTNTMYGPNPFTLSMFPRACQVAAAYQEYRISRIKWTFKPLFDTFGVNPDATTALSVPYFHSMLDKGGALPSNIGIAGLKAMGARPRRFDDKNVVVSYAPGVSTNVQEVVGGSLAPGANKPTTAPWLLTNADFASVAAWTPSTTLHNGVYYYLDARSVTGDGVYEYSIDVELQFQFRKPLIPVSIETPQASSATAHLLPGYVAPTEELTKVD